jgi:general stress protein 26
MKIQTQFTKEQIQLSQLIEDMPVAMLTTYNDEDLLVSRPMTPLEMDSEGDVWFFTQHDAMKSVHLNNANLAFSDTSKGTYVSLSGRGEIHKNKEDIHRLWSLSAKPWFPDGPDSPNLALLKFIPNTAEFWDTPNSRIVRLFSLAAAIITGKPVNTGDHDIIKNL